MPWRDERIVVSSIVKENSDDRTVITRMKARWTEIFGSDCPSITRAAAALAEDGCKHWLFKTSGKIGVAITLFGSNSMEPDCAEISIVPSKAMPE